MGEKRIEVGKLYISKSSPDSFSARVLSVPEGHVIYDFRVGKTDLIPDGRTNEIDDFLSTYRLAETWGEARRLAPLDVWDELKEQYKDGESVMEKPRLEVGKLYLRKKSASGGPSSARILAIRGDLVRYDFRTSERDGYFAGHERSIDKFLETYELVQNLETAKQLAPRDVWDELEKSYCDVPPERGVGVLGEESRESEVSEIQIGKLYVWKESLRKTAETEHYAACVLLIEDGTVFYDFCRNIKDSVYFSRTDSVERFVETHKLVENWEEVRKKGLEEWGARLRRAYGAAKEPSVSEEREGQSEESREGGVDRDRELPSLGGVSIRNFRIVESGDAPYILAELTGGNIRGFVEAIKETPDVDLAEALEMWATSQRMERAFVRCIVRKKEKMKAPPLLELEKRRREESDW